MLIYWTNKIAGLIVEDFYKTVYTKKNPKPLNTIHKTIIKVESREFSIIINDKWSVYDGLDN